MREAKILKKITYRLGYSNFSFELWLILHKKECNGSFNHRRQYLVPINQAFGESFEDLDQYKQEGNFKRCLSKLTLEDVKHAIRRADAITARNEKDAKILVKYKGYSYYRDNPSLSIHEVIHLIMAECGVL